MTTQRLQPSPLADVQLQDERNRWTLVLVRELRHPPQQVWEALTAPAALREWAPFDADRDLGATGPALLTMAGEPSAEPLASLVRHAQAPRLLEYTWGEDVLRWELEPTVSGTRLTLRHAISERSWAPKVTAGWHLCLDVAERLLAGQPIGRIVGDAARQHGWVELNEAYAARLGIESSDFPTEAERIARTR